MLTPTSQHSPKKIDIRPCLFPPLSHFVVPENCVCNIDIDRKWDKRDKSTHRYEIADVNGPISLTVPVMKPDSFSEARLKDIHLSRHGQWWHVHKFTLESAYGRTPYFEHYFPLLEKFFDADTVERYPLLYSYLQATYTSISRLLDIDTKFEISESEDQSMIFEPDSLSLKYHQIREDLLGFIPNLSVLDILFNIGPETQLYLRNLRNKAA